MSKKINVYIVIWMLVNVFSFISLFYLLSNTENVYSVYRNSFTANLFFIILNFLAFKVYQNPNKYLLIPIAYTFIRMVVTPFVMTLTNNVTYFSSISKHQFDYGIILACFEATIIFVSVYWINSKYKINTFTPLHISKKNNTVFYISLCILVLIIGAIMLVYPIFMNRFKSIFDLTRDGIFIENNDFQGIQRIMFSLVFYFIPWVKFILTVSLLKLIKIRSRNGFQGLFLSILLILMNGFFIEGANGLFVIYNIVYVVIIVRLYKEQSKHLFIPSILILSYFLYSIFFQKTGSFDTNSKLTDLSLIFQSYIPGLPNYAGLFNFDVSNKFNFLLGDIVSSIPFNVFLFGNNFTRLVIPYTQQNNALSQIMPFIGHLFEYISFLSFAVIPIILYSGLKIIQKAYLEDDVFIFSAKLLIGLYVLFTPGFFNIAILLERTLSILLPILLFTKLSKIKTKGVI